MDPFCPSCRAAFVGTPRCPRCGGDRGAPAEVTAADRPGTTPAGRVLVGTLAALGMAVGLSDVAAGVGAVAPGVIEGVRAAAVALGAALAGVGLRRGLPAGAVVGGVCGAAFLLADGPPAEPLLYVVPAALAVLGGLAGAVGAWVWPAPAPVAPPSRPPATGSSIRLAADPPSAAGQRTAWVRLAAGAAVIAAGVGLADELRVKAQRNSGGLLHVDTRGQGRLLSLPLAGLTALAGGAVAAAGTGAGLRPGGLAGAVAAAGVVGLALARGELPVPAAVALDRLGVAGGPQDPTALVAVAAGVVGLGVAGGWFGGALFPKLAPRAMRNRQARLGGD